MSEDRRPLWKPVNQPLAPPPAMASLQDRIAQLEEIIQQLSQAPQAPEPPAVKPPKVADPEPFSGDRQRLRPFLNSLSIKFTGNAYQFPDEATKIIYAASYLRGAAALWFEPQLNPQTPNRIETYQAFQEKIKEAFGDPDEKGTAERRLQHLQQGNRTFTSYFSEFQQLCFRTTLDDRSKLIFLRNGVARHIQEWVMSQLGSPAWTLAEFVTNVTQYDNQWRRYRENTAPRTRTEDPKPRNADGTYKPQSQAQANPTPRTHGDAQRDGFLGDMPMELDAARRRKLTQDEREYLMKNRGCFRCRKLGHFAFECPLSTPGPRPRPQNQPRQQNAPAPRRINQIQAAEEDIVSVAGGVQLKDEDQ